MAISSYMSENLQEVNSHNSHNVKLKKVNSEYFFEQHSKKFYLKKFTGMNRQIFSNFSSFLVIFKNLLRNEDGLLQIFQNLGEVYLPHVQV